MFTTIAAGMVLLAGPKFSFYDNGPYDAAVPKPESQLGYELGEKHTVFRDQERVVLAIAGAARSKVVPVEYGKSTEGRTLRVFAISSPENIKRLAQIKADHMALSQGKSDSEMSSILERTPAIVWVNECIHGDETASFESGMALLYNLAASRGKRIDDMLSNVVVILNPVYNPDGHERYVVAYNSLPQGNSGWYSMDRAVPSAFFGRANHYRFDMNRDRVAMSQQETRQEVAEYLRWNPQVYIDQHGQVENYFFPPVQQSINANVDRERYKKWTEIFGRATAGAFDQVGWSYFVRNEFDFYNVCYLDTHSTLMGAIGMTQETNGGRVIAEPQSDGSVVTLREGVAKHFTSALAVIETASKNRKSLLESYAHYKQSAASGAQAGKFRRVVLTSDDPRPLLRFAENLRRTGIESHFAAEAWSQSDTHDYWSSQSGNYRFPSGSLVVDIAQPMGHLAKTWLEPGSDFEADFIARQKQKAEVDRTGKGTSEIDSYEFYDSTAWCRVYGYGLQARWCESAPKVAWGDASKVVPASINGSSVGFFLPYRDQDDLLFAARALGKDIRVSMARKPMKVSGVYIPRGAFLFLAQRNDEGFEKKLVDLAKSANVALQSLKSSYPDEGRDGPGSSNMLQLRKPNIGIVMGSSGNLGDVGPLWFLMEREFKLPFASLSAAALTGSLDNYSTLVIPAGVAASASGKLGEWVRAGGCLVVLDNPGWALGSGGFATLETASTAPDLPGALFMAELDENSFLSFGYDRLGDAMQIAVPIDGSSFYKAPTSGSVVQLSNDAGTKKLLSGWVWDDTEKSIAGTVWLHDAPAGRGRAVIFTHNPTERAQWPGLYKLLLNAMLIGPGA